MAFFIYRGDATLFTFGGGQDRGPTGPARETEPILSNNDFTRDQLHSRHRAEATKAGILKVRAIGSFPSTSIGAGFMPRLSNDQQTGATQLYFLLVRLGPLRGPDTRKDRHTAQAL